LEVIRLGEFNSNALEQYIEIQPFESALNAANNQINNFACLKRLDYLLGFIDNYDQKILAKYVENLKNKFQGLLKEDFLGNNKSIFSEMLERKNHLNRYPVLAENTLNFNLQLLKLSNAVNWMSDIVKVKQGDYISSYLVPNYYYLLVLVETIGRDDAIKLFKRYITQFLTDQKTISNVTFTTLEDVFEKRKRSAKNPSDWVMVCGLLSKGKYFFRNDNCLWIEVLEDFPDKELKYCVCCYGDYQNANSYSNGNIVLTMKQTIAQGDPYCCRVKHDTRIDWDLEHPKKEFFDSIWPIRK